MDYTIPASTTTTFKLGSKGMGVWAIQRCLNSFIDLGFKTAEDGVFAERTEINVKAYQGMVKLKTDGIVGPATQMRLAQSCIVRVDPEKTVPKNLLGALIRGESGGYIAAVNHSVPGGTDCGFVQRRVYNGATHATILEAFDPMYQIKKLKEDFNDLFKQFSRFAAVRSRPDAAEYAWRLAVLSHNWPAGAQQLAEGSALSDTKKATWVPASVKFPDGEPVNTYAEWAEFYSMGSCRHKWAGLMTKDTFTVPCKS